MENNQTNKPAKSQPQKRQRKPVYLDQEGSKMLETLKGNSSYSNPKDSIVNKRALEFAIFHKQDVNGDFEKFATLSDIEKINKKHIGKLNAAFEIFQSESFQSQQFTQQLLKQISEQLKEILERSNLPV